MQSFITINGTKFPQPRRGLELLSATIVDSARNANGVVVGQKVGRDQQKLNNLFWVKFKDDPHADRILADFMGADSTAAAQQLIDDFESRYRLEHCYERE